MKIETLKLIDVIADPKNPRTHSEDNLATIEASLRAHGQVEPVLIQKSTNRIIAGHGRVEALRRMGEQTVEVIRLDVSDQDADKLAVRLNRSAELAGWDENILGDLLRSFGDDAVNFGWADDDLTKLVATVDDGTEFLDQLANQPVDEPVKTPAIVAAPDTSREFGEFVDFVVPVTVAERVEIQRVLAAAKKALGVETTREALLGVVRAYTVGS